MFISNASKFPFFFKWHIWHDNAGDANLFAEGKEFFTTKYIDWVQVGHEHEWNSHCLFTSTQTAHHIEDIVDFYTCRKCTCTRFLDNWAFCCWIGEWNTDFYHVGAGFHHHANITFCIFNTMVTSTDEWDECLALCESVFNFTHEDPPLCISP